MKRTVIGFSFASAVACAVGYGYTSPSRAIAAPNASASVSAAPTPSASSAPGAKKARGNLATYSWPTETSERPKDEEWANATELEPFRLETGSLPGVRCEPRAIREWLQLTCTPPLFFGVLWGVAGELKDVKAWFKMVGELGPPADTSTVEMLKQPMGAIATVSFPVRPGGAFVLSLDQMNVDEGYDSISVDSGPGMIIDVSWAAGEKAPTVLFH